MTRITYQQKARQALDLMVEYPAHRFEGKGIVICAGGARYFTCAWVAITRLRALGCSLPIEVWYLGRSEMDQEMKRILGDKGVETVDALEVSREHPVRILNGWEVKPFSIIHSRFKEVLLLDADNVPVRDPTYLFDCAQYKDLGAVFWPDFSRLAADRDIWAICGIDYRDEPEFESGQMVLDKEKCWSPLQLTMHYNENSDYYYKHVHGDKETFHMAWRMLARDYAMPGKGIEALPGVMCQHDFEGNRVFQHRNLAKWELHDNIRIQGFMHELECLQAIEELRQQWCGRVTMPLPATAAGLDALQEITTTRAFLYERLGHDVRNMEFLCDGTIGIGSAAMERYWFVEDGPPPTLCIVGNSTTCRLNKGEDGNWEGAWLAHERMGIRLSATGAPTSILAGASIEKYVGCLLEYVRVGHDSRGMLLLPDGRIGDGRAAMEQVWWVESGQGRLLLMLGPREKEPICSLCLCADGIWRGNWLRFERMPIEIRQIKTPGSANDPLAPASAGDSLDRQRENQVEECHE